ncbi:MAG: T9SS type A sorting domain-containing protein [Candidatus Eisenbacteria bacterium]|nr:T9SS type A sorting domain-containing protein [Candidatus Latescibacterota bacterium]MBD3302619.1 T9SS type A sorting domain-containing protein [Candidatus Eisenbacteria bacterium]
MADRRNQMICMTFAALIALVATVTAPDRAGAALIESSWNGGTGVWSIAENWTPEEVPENGVDEYVVSIDGNGNFNSIVHLDMPTTITGLGIDLLDHLVIDPGNTLEVTSTGTTSIEGELTLGRLNAWGTIRVDTTGVLHFRDTVASAILAGFGANPLLHNAGGRVEGAGLVQIPVHNENGGIIDANGSDVVTELTVTVYEEGIDNSAILQASNGATLTLQNTVPDAVIDNADGVIQALADSEVQVGSAHSGGGLEITGGMIRGSNDGVVRFLEWGITAAMVRDADFEGSILIGSGHQVILAGEIGNAGEFRLEPSLTSSSTIRILGTVPLSGAGTVYMGDDNSRAYVTGEDAGAHLINVDNTIHGSGDLGRDQLRITNQGTIVADLSRVLAVDPNDGGFDNQGILQATSEAGIDLQDGPFTTSGEVTISEGSRLERDGDYVQTDGVTQIDGMLLASGVVDIQGGILTGFGAIEADYRGAGTVAPGASPGVLAVEGDYTQEATGVYEAELAGLMAGDEHDQIQVRDTAMLDGTLRIVLLDGYTPAPGDSFVVLTAATVDGAFAAVEIPDGVELEVRVREDAVVVQAQEVSGVADPAAGTGFGLRAYPNPAAAGPVRLVLLGDEAVAPIRVAIYDAAGRRVRELVSHSQSSGSSLLSWDRRNTSGRIVPPGIYFVRREDGSNGRTASERVVLTR